MSIAHIRKLIRFWQSRSQKVVFATGVFDLLHIEHFRFLQSARNAGDRLVVGIESDMRVRSIKGGLRPVNECKIRLEQLRAIRAVDSAFALPVEFDSQTQWENCMRFLRPDVYAVSSGSPFIENKRAICDKFGIEFRIVHRHNPDISTSLIISKLVNSPFRRPQPRYLGIVVSGHGRGKGMGFPTLNLKVPIGFPYQHGIYIGYVWLKRRRYEGVFHYGPVPTFRQRNVSLEVFLLRRRQDIKQSSITFQLVQYVRPIMPFASKNLLIEQIRRDVALAKILISAPSAGFNCG